MGKDKRIKALRKEAERNQLVEELKNVKPSKKVFGRLNVRMQKTMGIQVFLLVFSTIILLLYSFMLLFNTAAVLRVISENTEQAAKYLLTISEGKIIPVNDMVELESYEVASDGQINAVGKDGADYVSRAEVVIVEDTAGRTFFDKTEGVVITEATPDFALNLLQGVSYGWVLAYAVLFGAIMIYGHKNKWLVYDRKLPVILYFVIVFGFLLFTGGVVMLTCSGG
ncbi:MAG: hypothetical protein LBM93_05650 [Oscillospiraceae bacterium]|jgi:hypothetical protein|nr:hypothetical protein [Oscillospiraceae bacterium]